MSGLNGRGYHGDLNIWI